MENKTSSATKIYYGKLGHREAYNVSQYSTIINSKLYNIAENLEKTLDKEQKKLLFDLSWAYAGINSTSVDIRYNAGFQIGIGIGYECSTNKNNV